MRPKLGEAVFSSRFSVSWFSQLSAGSERLFSSELLGAFALLVGSSSIQDLDTFN